MLEKTYPDSVRDSFSGGQSTESGPRMYSNSTTANIQNQAMPVAEKQDMHNIKSRKHQPGDFAGTGNRCAHTPNILRDIPFKAEARRPIVIQQMLRASERLFNRPRGSKKGHGELIRVRSEGRESLVQYIQKLLYDLELSTMTVRNNDITFSKPTLKDITSDVDETGLSYTRAKRAQKILVEGGYLRVVRSPKYVNGEFKADPSEREVTPKLFKLLGLSNQEYSFQKHYKTKRLEKKGVKGAFQKEMVLKLKESLMSGQKKWVKTGSFPEKENHQHRQKLIGLYVEINLKLATPGVVSAGTLKSIAEKMTTDNIIAFLKRHTSNTS